MTDIRAETAGREERPGQSLVCRKGFQRHQQEAGLGCRGREHRGGGGRVPGGPVSGALGLVWAQLSHQIRARWLRTERGARAVFVRFLPLRKQKALSFFDLLCRGEAVLPHGLLRPPCVCAAGTAPSPSLRCSRWEVPRRAAASPALSGASSADVVGTSSLP